jgi:hypothetical protein
MMNMNDLAKPVSILHMVISLLMTLPVFILNPMGLYDDGIGSEPLNATPELSKMALPLPMIGAQDQGQV